MHGLVLNDSVSLLAESTRLLLKCSLGPTRNTRLKVPQLGIKVGPQLLLLLDCWSPKQTRSTEPQRKWQEQVTFGMSVKWEPLNIEWWPNTFQPTFYCPPNHTSVALVHLPRLELAYPPEDRGICSQSRQCTKNNSPHANSIWGLDNQPKRLGHPHRPGTASELHRHFGA